MTHAIAGDLGDPVFNAWILAWDATHLGRGWWNANIFYPHPLALAYSEHLLPQALSILPAYALTGNPILCYNLVFLSTFVLSALGMFLLTRELTGSRPAATVAGLAYAFAPYRFTSVPHVQVLSSAWMPFVLYGLRRYFERATTERGAMLPLAGAAAAWLLQNLSCGYYLLFFSPMVLMYIGWELTVRGRWTDRRLLAQVAIACAAVALGTAPFLLPYLELRRLGFSPRSLTETIRFSADTYAYLTADPNLRVIGPLMRFWAQDEGSLFPGFTILALAILGLVGSGRSAKASRSIDGSRSVEGARSVAWSARLQPSEPILATVLIASCAMLVALLFGYTLRLPFLKVTSVARTTWIALALAIALLVVSPRARAAAHAWLSHPIAIYSIVVFFAIVMSFGPQIHAKGRVVAERSLYAVFYNRVPGFDGVRVPARFGMIVALGLAVLAAYGVYTAKSVRAWRAAALASALIIVEALAVPLAMNTNSTSYKQVGLAPLPDALALTPEALATYEFLAKLPGESAIAELPLGEPAFDIRYMFYSTRHWKRLVNGYSGGEPDDYSLLNHALQDALIRPDRAWDALLASRATHAVVHESFYDGDRGERISGWLRARGAREVAAFGTHHIFTLPLH